MKGTIVPATFKNYRKGEIMKLECIDFFFFFFTLFWISSAQWYAVDCERSTRGNRLENRNNVKWITASPFIMLIDLFFTWIFKVFVGRGAGLGHACQCILHYLDVSDWAVALWELFTTLTDALAVSTQVLPFSIAHDVTECRLDKLFLEVFRENDLQTCRGRKT